LFTASPPCRSLLPFLRLLHARQSTAWFPSGEASRPVGRRHHPFFLSVSSTFSLLENCARSGLTEPVRQCPMMSPLLSCACFDIPFPPSLLQRSLYEYLSFPFFHPLAGHVNLRSPRPAGHFDCLLFFLLLQFPRHVWLIRAVLSL